MAATQEMVKIAYEVKPDVVTLVPERREELTTEGGLDVAGQRAHRRKVVKTLEDAEINVSLFIDPDLDQVKAAHRVEAGRVGRVPHRPLLRGAARRRSSRELSRLVDACKAAAKLGLEVAAGHGLNYQNVRPVAAHPGDRGAEHRPRDRGAGGARRVGAGGARDEGAHREARLAARRARWSGEGRDPRARHGRRRGRADRADPGPVRPRARSGSSRAASPRPSAGYCDGARDRATRYAARFAAKEAASKALGAPAGIRFHDVEVVRGEGAPRSSSPGSPRTPPLGSASAARSSR